MRRTGVAAVVGAVAAMAGLLAAVWWQAAAPRGAAAAAPAPGGGAWRVPIGPGRALVLDVPQGWRMTVRRPVAGPPTVLIGPSEGDAFRFLVTPLLQGGGAPLDGTRLKGFLHQIGQRVVARSVEGRIDLEPVPGAAGAWYYRLTDREPGEGYRHLAQGARAFDGVVMTFTFLSHVPDPPALAEALRVVATARVE